MKIFWNFNMMCYTLLSSCWCKKNWGSPFILKSYDHLCITRNSEFLPLRNERLTSIWRPSWKMAAILDFHMANQPDLISIFLRTTMRNFIQIDEEESILWIKSIFGRLIWRPSWKMAAILDFQVASRADLLSIPMRITVQTLVLVSQFAQFCPKIDFSCSTKIARLSLSPVCDKRPCTNDLAITL